MYVKDVKLKADTKRLLNRSRAEVLLIKPDMKVSDNNVLNYILKRFLEG